MPRCVRVEGGAGGAACDVYFRLKGVVNDMWDTGAPPGAPFDRWVKRYPFAIGRVKCADEELGLTGEDESWLLSESQKVSRRHAVIFWDDRTQQFKIRCYSSNGVDVNQRHISKDEEAPLPSRSTVRIGPLYLFFLLPREKLPVAGGAGASAAGAGAGAGAAAAAAGGAAGAPAKKRSMPGGYAAVLEAVFKRHFQQFGVFTLADLTRLALAEFPAHGLQDDHAKLSATLSRTVTAHADYDLLAAGACPPAESVASYEAVYAGGAAQKAARWAKRLTAAEAAAKRTRVAAAAAAKAEKAGAGGGGGGGGGGAGVIEVE